MQPTNWWINACGLALLSGCATSDSATPAKGRPVAKVYKEARRESEAASTLKTQLRFDAPHAGISPAESALSAPEVFNVYVPPHVSADGHASVQGHWVQLRLRESRWWHEREVQPTPFNLQRLGGGLPHKRIEPPPVPTPAPAPAPAPELEDIQAQAPSR